MSRHSVSTLQENETITETYRLLEKSLRPNKNGVLFLQFVLNDRTGSVAARFWNATEELASLYENGDFVKCEGRVQRFQGALQVIVSKMTKLDPSEVEPEEFGVSNVVDVSALTQRLTEILQTLTNPSLVNLMNAFLLDGDFMLRFTRTFAGVRLHHAYQGGLLEHTVSMMELALRVGEQYKHIVDPDLLLVGAFLHDIGKVRELSDDSFAPVYTDEGQALGHPYLGAEMLACKIAALETSTGETFDPKLAMELKHLILSHPGEVNFGAVKTPMSREAIALHFIDSLDAKLNEFQKYIMEDPNLGKGWTNFIPSLDRKLMK